MKTTKEIHEMFERDDEIETNHEGNLWYSLKELQQARTYGIRDLRDMIQSDLNKLFKKYTQDFDKINDELEKDNET